MEQVTGAKADLEAAKKLKQIAHQGFTLNPGNCSGAVRYVIQSLVDPSEPVLSANALMRRFAARGSGWKKVSLQEASALASRGKVVVGGLEKSGNHGHVVVVLPGPWQSSGGYIANGKMTKSHGLFPPAMSTAWHPPGHKAWPGAISDGDKTVRDAWGAKEFNLVTFWTKE